MADKERKRVTVEIHNRPYTMMGTESPSHMRLVASLVNQKMQEIQEHNESLDTTKLAVLTAVNTMNDYLKLKEDYASLLGSQRNDKDKK